MKRTMATVLAILALTLGNSQQRLKGEPSSAPRDDDADIRQAVAAYVDAFNQHDGEKLADLWSPEAVYLNRLTGEKVTGRTAIAEQFAAIFKDKPELKMSVKTEAIQFLSPNVAVEHGTAQLVSPKAEPEETEYAAVYVKRDGQWLLDRVTDDEKQTPPSHYDQLKQLEWMVGQWTDKEGGNVDAEADCHWTKNRNFLVRSFAVSVRNQIEMSGMQVIGWDPAAKTIRSWTFDADGTFADATWTQIGDSWYVRNRGVVADGRRASMVNVIKPVDQNSFTWQTVERTVGGELLPNIDEVLIVRK